MSADDMTLDGMDPAEIQELVALARSVTADDRNLLAPPDDLWAGIEAAIAAPDATQRGLVDLGSERRRRRSFSPLLLSAAAALVVAVAAVGIFVGLGGDDEAPIVATVDLDPLADGYQASVDLHDDDGRFVLDVDFADLPPADEGYYELWLIKDLTTGEMQSLGPIESSGTVVLPSGLDPDAYATVDISIEPLDGVPTHSGVSVLRGTLTS